MELISYENVNNQYNPRIFKFKSINRSCDHWLAGGRGGGPENAQHEWMKLRLTRIAGKLGYNATPEHAPTHADVYVHEASFCLEVQLKPTRFRKRTAVREAKGVKVCWLIREGLDSEKAVKALFGLPAVRFGVVDRNDPGRLLSPWDQPADRDLATRARLEVFGTAGALFEGTGVVVTRRQVLRGFRRTRWMASTSLTRSSLAVGDGTDQACLGTSGDYGH